MLVDMEVKEEKKESEGIKKRLHLMSSQIQEKDQQITELEKYKALVLSLHERGVINESGDIKQ